jgi:small subunit ribosomal protein S14
MNVIQRRVFKDIKKRIAFLKAEEQKIVLLSIRKSEEIKDTAAWWNVIEIINSLGGKGSLTRIRNVCKYTGRTRGILSNYGLSRLEWRRKADKGEIPGVRRASW